MTGRSRAYHDSVQRMRRLDALMRQGLGGSAEATELRRQMDAPWYEMSEDECALIELLSADLYTLWNATQTGLEPSSESQRRFDSFINDQRWKEALSLLHELPGLMDPAAAALLRSQFWLAHGEVEVAADFLVTGHRLSRVAVAMLPPKTRTSRRRQRVRYPDYNGIEAGP